MVAWKNETSADDLAGVFSFDKSIESVIIMPTKPKRPCSVPGCPNLCYGLYCEKHAAEQRRQYDKYERSPDVHKKYGRGWSRIRNRYFLKHPYCERCFDEGRMVKAEEVHHIVPISKNGTNDEANLMSLCRSCHNKIHIEMGDR